MRLDDISLSILRHLRDGRKSFNKIAEELSIAENTVRARVNKLEELGILGITGMVDPTLIDGHSTVIIGIKLLSMNLVEKGEEFSKLRGVTSVSVVTGQYDLILTVLLKEGFGLLEFFSEEVAQIENVQSVETFLVYKSFNLKLPYVL